jgi:hypothetical protein
VSGARARTLLCGADMRLARLFSPGVVPLLFAGVLVACGGKTSGIPGGGGASGSPDSGAGTGSGLADAGSQVDTSTQSGRDAAVCVEVDPASLDQSCASDGDCTLVHTGQLCDGDCARCEPNTAVNASGLQAYQADTASIVQGQCGKCVSFGPASCIANRCTFCPEPGGCTDSGTTETNDASPPPVDAGDCIQVNPSSFSRACASNNDCILVTTGILCSGGCACGDTPINNASLAAYEALTSSIMLEGCPCSDPGQPTCIQGTCTLCSFGPNQPPGCGDGG